MHHSPLFFIHPRVPSKKWPDFRWLQVTSAPIFWAPAPRGPLRCTTRAGRRALAGSKVVVAWGDHPKHQKSMFFIGKSSTPWKKNQLLLGYYCFFPQEKHQTDGIDGILGCPLFYGTTFFSCFDVDTLKQFIHFFAGYGWHQSAHPNIPTLLHNYHC